MNPQPHRQPPPLPPAPAPAPLRFRKLGVDGGLLLGIALIGLGLGALIVKGFDRPEARDLYEQYSDLAYFDPYSNGGYAPVDVNTASREDLLLHPMISERIADGIIAGRPFRLTEDLLEVRGIGELNIEILSTYLYGFEDQPEPRPVKPPGIPDA